MRSKWAKPAKVIPEKKPAAPKNVILAAKLLDAGVPPEVATQMTGVSSEDATALAQYATEIKPVADNIKKMLSDQCYLLAYRAMGAVNDEKLHYAPLTSLSTFAGTMIDKARLLEGQPTEIIAAYVTVIEKYIRKPAIDVTPTLGV